MSDVTAYHRHCNTDAVLHYLGGPTSKRHVRDEVAWFRWHQRSRGFTFWVVERKRDKALLGFCGIIRVPDQGSAVYGELEIGWRIRSDMWRRGYAFEAATGVIQLARATLAEERLVARIAADNRASWRLARKLGMRHEKRLDYVDDSDGMRYHIYALDNRKGR
ncbi:GNAT family N-acetyltransferase [Altererythrobacter aurantiacus]|uniref:GNAT family N-acetyltransferase n=2 Tax=Parapontixanthobacter aurantiacus TaxID=1463599 RepID=A0A844ZH87_9SPHN|nr:GNAT family N-acetyltransferase [Parapontixanthobacter aurantiacus]